jgi:hypothetical protein
VKMRETSPFESSYTVSLICVKHELQGHENHNIGKHRSTKLDTWENVTSVSIVVVSQSGMLDCAATTAAIARQSQSCMTQARNNNHKPIKFTHKLAHSLART